MAFRYFEMKLLPWECFHLSPLIMMGRNNEQYSSQNSRKKGNKGRKMKLEEQVPKEGLMSSVKAQPWVHLRRMGAVHRAAVFLQGSGFPHSPEAGGPEVGGGDAPALLGRGLSCSFLLGLCVGRGVWGGVGKRDLPNPDASSHFSVPILAKGQSA